MLKRARRRRPPPPRAKQTRSPQRLQLQRERQTLPYRQLATLSLPAGQRKQRLRHGEQKQKRVRLPAALRRRLLPATPSEKQLPRALLRSRLRQHARQRLRLPQHGF